MNAADQAISFARSQIGKPYVFGGIGPNGYDCSGLIQTSYRTAGITLPRVSQAQVFSGTGLSKEQLQAGDLVFPDIGHVQLYVGNGQVIEAAHSGTNVRQVNMWGFQYGRRVTPPGLNVINTGLDINPWQLVSPFGAGIGGIGDVAGTVGKIYDMLASFGNVISFFSSGHNWIRAAEFLGGLLLLFLGIKGLQ